MDAVITQNVVPLWREPNSRSEQVSQAILGESVTLLESQEAFCHIRAEDGYEGWVRSHHLRLYHRGIEESEVVWGGNLEQGFWHRVVTLFAPMRHRPYPESGIMTQLVFGTFVAARSAQETPEAFIHIEIPSSKDPESLFQSGYLSADCLERCEGYPAFDGAVASEIAQQFLGIPYLWGGGTPFGFDCSGFVQRIYKHFGILLPRDAHLQVDSPLLASLAEHQPFRAGDLLFFGSDHDPENRGITHVGMALGADVFIHACGKEGVTLTPVKDPYYLSILRTARRFQ